VQQPHLEAWTETEQDDKRHVPNDDRGGAQRGYEDKEPWEISTIDMGDVRQRPVHLWHKQSGENKREENKTKKNCYKKKENARKPEVVKKLLTSNSSSWCLHVQHMLPTGFISLWVELISQLEMRDGIVLRRGLVGLCSRTGDAHFAEGTRALWSTSRKGLHLQAPTCFTAYSWRLNALTIYECTISHKPL